MIDFLDMIMVAIIAFGIGSCLYGLYELYLRLEALRRLRRHLKEVEKG